MLEHHTDSAIAEEEANYYASQIVAPDCIVLPVLTCNRQHDISVVREHLGTSWETASIKVSQVNRNLFKKALDRSGLPHFRFHDLRHYQASILHAMGVPDKYIMERGGWKTDSTLKNIYQHTMSDKRKEVEEGICELFDSKHKSG